MGGDCRPLQRLRFQHRPAARIQLEHGRRHQGTKNRTWTKQYHNKRTWWSEFRSKDGTRIDGNDARNAAVATRNAGPVLAAAVLTTAANDDGSIAAAAITSFLGVLTTVKKMSGCTTHKTDSSD